MCKKIEIICIGCPKGCSLEVQTVTGIVSGHLCEKGQVYARKEILHPTRMLTGTVKIAHGSVPVISVKTASDIPKDKMMECMRVMKTIVVQAPIALGACIVPNIADTGVALIATKAVNISGGEKWHYN